MSSIPPDVFSRAACTPTTGHPPPIAGTEGSVSLKLVLAALPGNKHEGCWPEYGSCCELERVAAKSHARSLSVQRSRACIPARQASACWSSVAAALTNNRCADFLSSVVPIVATRLPLSWLWMPCFHEAKKRCQLGPQHAQQMQLSTAVSMPLL